MKIIFIIVFCLTASLLVHAQNDAPKPTAQTEVQKPSTQSDAPKPNEWKGLKIDRTTAEEALKKFNTPKKDEKDKILAIKNKWLTKKAQEKIWRVLHWENIEGFEDVKLFFDENNKLVVIQLEPKQLTAQAFSNAYDIPLKPMFSGFSEGLNPKNFERNEGKLYAKNYPSIYQIIGVTDDVFLFAGISNSSMGSILKESMGVKDAEGNYPGKVYILQLISRNLENKDNVDILK